MSSLNSEAVILRTWPVHEADLVVSFFTREYGKLRGIGKSAMKSRKRFGGALEPMSLTRAWFVEKPRQDLVRLDQLELLRSPMLLKVDAIRMTVLSFYAELLDEALPERDPQETIFRLLLAVLEQTTAENPWMPLTYFQLWMTRLMGLLPELNHCLACGEALQAGGIYFHLTNDGLYCARHRPEHSAQLSDDSWQVARMMLREPVARFAAFEWPRRRGLDLRRFTMQSLERHMEKRLRSWEALRRLGG